MEKIDKLKKIFKREKIDGYIVPKNDEFFGEYIPDHKDRLKYISNFSGSYGFALILKIKIIYLLMADTLYKQINKVLIFLILKQFQNVYLKIFCEIKN